METKQPESSPIVKFLRAVLVGGFKDESIRDENMYQYARQIADSCPAGSRDKTEIEDILLEYEKNQERP